MVEESYWASDYWHAMDRSKGKKDILNVNPQQVGISHGIGDPLQGLKGNIFVGASQVELGFMGAGKGSRSSPTGWTPESVSKPEREAIKQLAKINEVQLSTHATPNVAVSGFDERKQGFSDEAQQQALHEIKKAVDFAADTAGGGPVVFHAMEFPRPIFERYKKEKFEQYPGEEKKAPLHIVDKRTGQVVALPRNQQVAIPKGSIDNPERDGRGFIKWESKTVSELEREAIRKKEDPIQYIYGNILAKETEYDEGQEREISNRIKRYREQHENLLEEKKKVEKELKKDIALGEYEAIRVMETYGGAPRPGTVEYKNFLKDPLKKFDELIHETKSNYENQLEVERAFGRRAFERNQQLKNMAPIEEYGVKQSAQAFAKAAMYGYDVEKSQNLKKPVMIVPENWTPEMYGSHPQELKKLVQESRKVMADELVEKRGMDQEHAQKIASERIKATFDIGHVNMWRKYFHGSDEEFKNWMDKEVKSLMKDNIIGHVHVTDNFGYHDEHLTPGEGTAPIKEFLQRLETEGYKGSIIGEPGGQPEGQVFKAMTGTWGLSDYGMYRVDGMSRSWSDIEGSYFGRTEGPRFVVGDFAPSKEWTLWSEVPLE